MLFTIAVALLLAWLCGVAGLFDIGELVHMLLLVGLMLAMLAFLKAREGARRVGVAPRDE